MSGPLLAKQQRGASPPTLLEHTQDVVDAAAALFGSLSQLTRLGHAWLRFFRVPETHWDEFHQTLLAAALFHDWGKANQGMQDVLAGRARSQLVHHEHLSVLLLGCEGVNRWLQQRADIDWDIVLAAVGSHHLRFSDADLAGDGSDDTVRMLCDHPDFQSQLLPWIATKLGLNGRPEFPPESHWGFVAELGVFNPTKLWKDLRDGRLRRLSLLTRDDGLLKRPLLNAVRAALIVADAAGSGLRRTGTSVTTWIQEQFDEAELCSPDFVNQLVRRRIDDLQCRGKWRDWNEFQRACDLLPSRSVLLAPCGSGKTLAAWRWISAQTKQRVVKRIIFLYPTRATATEGFKDYVSWAPEADAGLMHGTADYDLDGMFPAEDPRSAKGFSDTDPRLFAIRHWSKRVFSATVDQFFAFLSYSYGPMCLLPLLADSVIVVDEVHSFDRKMFSALLGFLKAFDVPVLAMTATLQAGRKAQLAAVMEHVYSERPGELATIAETARYRVSQISEDAVEQTIRAAVENGKRVLCVVNQVSRAQQLAIRFRNAGQRVICYHSRFRLDDRVKRHRETVDAIRAGCPPAVAISTQVCEMSLDIDADVLVTEECPIPSLIQRMGRCRRGRDELTTKGPGEVFVYQPQNESVYKKGDLIGLDGFLKFLTSKPAVSQTDLEAALDNFGDKTIDAPTLNSFLASGAFAVSGADSFRDLEAFNVSAVLRSEIPRYVAASPSQQPGFIVPVPRKVKPARDPRLPSFLFVADDKHYDDQTGFWDQPLS